MTTDERVQAVVDYGFTERQARFLVLVMRHAGLCVKRQYAAFADIANGGEKCNAFFNKLIRRGFAVAANCIHNRARLYHIHPSRSVTRLPSLIAAIVGQYPHGPPPSVSCESTPRSPVPISTG